MTEAEVSNTPETTESLDTNVASTTKTESNIIATLERDEVVTLEEFNRFLVFYNSIAIILCLSSTICSIFSIVVYVQQRRDAYAVFMLGLCLGDVLYVTMNGLHAASTIFVRATSLYQRVIDLYINGYMGQAARQAAVCLNALACLQRLMVIAFPFNLAVRINSTRLAVVVVVVVFFTPFCCDIYVLLGYQNVQFDDGMWTTVLTALYRNNMETFSIITNVIRIMLVYIPVASSLLWNAALVLFLLRYAAKRREMQTTSGHYRKACALVANTSGHVSKASMADEKEISRPTSDKANRSYLSGDGTPIINYFEGRSDKKNSVIARSTSLNIIHNDSFDLVSHETEVHASIPDFSHACIRENDITSTFQLGCGKETSETITLSRQVLKFNCSSAKEPQSDTADSRTPRIRNQYTVTGQSGAKGDARLPSNTTYTTRLIHLLSFTFALLALPVFINATLGTILPDYGIFKREYYFFLIVNMSLTLVTHSTQTVLFIISMTYSRRFRSTLKTTLSWARSKEGIN